MVRLSSDVAVGSGCTWGRPAAGGPRPEQNCRRGVGRLRAFAARFPRQTRPADGRMQIEPSSQPKQAISKSVAACVRIRGEGSEVVEASNEVGQLQML